MRKRDAIQRLSAAFAAVIGGSACASGPEARVECGEPVPMALTIEATARLNPDGDGRALPTELRVYQLSDVRALDSASFEDVWQRPAEVLGEALLSEESITIYPSERVDRQLRPDPAAVAVVAVLIVRQPTGRTWRALVPMTRPSGTEESCPMAQPGRVLLRLDEYRVEAVTPRILENRT